MVVTLQGKKIELNLVCIISPEHSFIQPLKAEGFINSWPELSWRHFSLVWQNCPLKQSVQQAALRSHFQQAPAGASHSPAQADCQDVAHKMAHLSCCTLGGDGPGSDPDPCPSLLPPFALALELSHRERAPCPRSHKLLSTASPALCLSCTVAAGQGAAPACPTLSVLPADGCWTDRQGEHEGKDSNFPLYLDWTGG